MIRLVADCSEPLCQAWYAWYPISTNRHVPLGTNESMQSFFFSLAVTAVHRHYQLTSTDDAFARRTREQRKIHTFRNQNKHFDGPIQWRMALDSLPDTRSRAVIDNLIMKKRKKNNSNTVASCDSQRNRLFFFVAAIRCSLGWERQTVVDHFRFFFFGFHYFRFQSLRRRSMRNLGQIEVSAVQFWK